MKTEARSPPTVDRIDLARRMSSSSAPAQPLRLPTFALNLSFACLSRPALCLFHPPSLHLLLAKPLGIHNTMSLLALIDKARLQDVELLSSKKDESKARAVTVTRCPLRMLLG